MRKAILLIAGLSIVAACQHDEKAVAGKGGSATVKLYPQHHQEARNLINMKVYVKYNALDAPSNGVYDDSVACTNRDNLAEGIMTGLKNGDYYFYSTGTDTSVQEAMHGGQRWTITVQGTQTVAIPVSEL